MVKVITYGTYDMLHYGHIRLLERAKALGDYLIVGITSDDYDKTRGKINLQQSLMERVEAVKATGLADEIIIEEYEGQKIDDIKRYQVDIFTVGSDWVGKFDYLQEYCEVVYLPRTEGISSTDLREEKRLVHIGIVGSNMVLSKFIRECDYVNGAKISGICSDDLNKELNFPEGVPVYSIAQYEEFLDQMDAVYIVTHPAEHYSHIKQALLKRKHVLCESPIALSTDQCTELWSIAEQNGCVLMDGIKTAYATAYSRLLVLVKSGAIGDVVSVDAVCTSMRDIDAIQRLELDERWNSICGWGPTALLPIFQILGTNYLKKTIVSKTIGTDANFDVFSKIDLIYSNAVASLRVGKGVKSEGELVISGTKGYVYVPAPWWLTDYFEVRFENATQNKRYFHQLDGEGIRYEIVAFIKSIQNKGRYNVISQECSGAIVKMIESFYQGTDRLNIIQP